MTVASTEELILAELGGSPGEDSGPTASRSLPDITRALSLSSHRLSDRIELASTLETLREQGLIAVDAPDDAGLTDEQVAFTLTDAGRERARDVRARLESAAIEVVDGTSEERTLAEAASSLDESLVAVAAELTDEGVYYTRDTPTREFVGRRGSLETCETALDGVREGTGQAVFVVGPPGVGKTTLAERVLDCAADDGFDVLRARCRGSGAGPYQPVRDALADVDANPFAAVGPAVEDADAYRTQQTALFNDVTDALAADATPSRPRVLYLDDLHLADAATVAYLEYLLDRIRDLPLAVVCSYRPAELPDDAPVAPDRVSTDESVTRVDLSPFGPEGTRALIERVLEQRGVPEAFVEAVHERTGGNPLFVEETVSTLLETEQLDPDLGVYPGSPSAIDVPEAVRETIDRRIAQFPAPARELLEWASLLGEQFQAAVLESVSDLPPAQLHTYLELFVDGALFDRGADGVVQFRSEVVREALLAEIPDAERERRHEAIARTLEASGAEGSAALDPSKERAGSIAHHYERANDGDEAIRWYRRAAEHATDVYAHDVAIEHYHGALELAREADDRETILAIVAELADIYITTGAYDEAERHVRFARERASDGARQRRLALLASRIATERGDYERARELADDGLERAGETPSRIACELLGQKAEIERSRSEYARAQELAERQRAMADDLEAPGMRATALHRLGATAIRRGDFAEAEAYHRRSLEIKRDRNDRHGVADSYKNLGAAARHRGRYDEARDYFERALEIYRDVGDRHEVAQIQNNLGIVAWRQGRYDEARDDYERALEIKRDVGDRHGVAKSYINLGIVANSQGRYDEARDDYERALAVFRDLDLRYEIAKTLYNLGSLASDRGRHEEARDYYERALEISRDVGAAHEIAKTRHALGEVAREQGRYDDADDHIQSALEGHRSADAEHEEAGCRLSLGRLALERESIATAREHGERALETLTELEATEEVLEALELLVECALEAGDHEQGREWCRRALATLEERDDDAFDDQREWFERKLETLEERSAE